MLGALAKKLFGSVNDRRVKSFRPRVAAINALESEVAKLTDDELRARTDMFRAELADGKELDDLLVPAFATVREAAKRVLGQRHFDVQLIGGMVLHESGIAEMKTGEGKTLVATLPVYLNALAGKGVHVVTVNDYLARRDAEWMGQIYNFLGMSVGIIVHGLDDSERRASYGCDITYGTNNEFGFDYLRDNMKYEIAQMSQRGHHYAIVDEVDSILVDEARTPLIISGPLDDKSDLYAAIDKLIPRLDKSDYEVDEKQRQVSLTESGNERIEELLLEAGLISEGGLYESANVITVHHVNQALRAHGLFQKDKDYIVRHDPEKGYAEVVIIDEFSGRMMPGRRYSEGLHQALEAKEHVPVQPENATLATITFQNYFRLYEKLAGMTGTAATEAEEFQQIYRLDVVEIPTNVPVARLDEEDEIYRTFDEKVDAIIRDIEAATLRRQPVLVGTASIEKSELIADRLLKAGFSMVDFTDPKALESLYEGARKGVPSRKIAVLNARFHEQEAYIVAEAGVPGAITIATNMAGRGTDIKLGGSVDMRIALETAAMEDGEAKQARIAAIRAEVESFRQIVLNAGETVEIAPAKGARAAKTITHPGGLYIIGTERHESRRIDNQLRGRSGRQGDPGRSKFYLSVEDDLMRIFGAERMDTMLVKLGHQPGEAIVHPWLSKAVERAQGKVEARNFEIRKNILKYDDVMNDQRKVVFEQRREFMSQASIRETIDTMRHDTIDDVVHRNIPPESYPEQWNIEKLDQEVAAYLNLRPPVADWAKEEGIAEAEMIERLRDLADTDYKARIERNGDDLMTYVEKQVLLQTLDHLWQEHLVTLDYLRQVVGWRGYAQRDPLNEYKSEAFELFDTMIARLREQVTGHMMRIEIVSDDRGDESMQMVPAGPAGMLSASGPAGMLSAAAASPGLIAEVPAGERDPNDQSSWGKVGRNEACPCGSGKKYKHCHGQFA
jgi:preprotein translocase subunit SecA